MLFFPPIWFTSHRLLFSHQDKQRDTYLNAGLGEIQAHCELFSGKKEKKEKAQRRGEERKGRETERKRFKVTGRRLEATHNCCLVHSCCSLSTIDRNRLDFFPPPRHELQKDAVAIFYFPCHGWVEIGLVIVRFSLAQACHCNNIMVGIMTSKLACHKAIDAPFSCKMGLLCKLDLQVALK